jgi:hypothetical protein
MAIKGRGLQEEKRFREQRILLGAKATSAEPSSPAEDRDQEKSLGLGTEVGP